MSYSCPKCPFKANFESALKMHKQLHHDNTAQHSNDPPKLPNKFNTIPREKEQIFPIKSKKSLRSLTRSSSATRLFDKIRVRLCKSKLLFSHPEETEEQNVSDSENIQYKSPSNIMSEVKPVAVLKEIPRIEKPNESFNCHLCSLEADRITVLDRHLLNDHKIGMENLLKLVMDKTRDGLADNSSKHGYEERKSYYKPSDEIIMETELNNIKIFKHTATNTDLTWIDIPNLVGFRTASNQIEEHFDMSTGNENKEFFEKMRTINEYMTRFLSSSKTLNKVLSKELSHKDISRTNGRSSRLGLGDQEPKARCFNEGLRRDRPRFEDNNNQYFL